MTLLSRAAAAHRPRAASPTTQHDDKADDNQQDNHPLTAPMIRTHSLMHGQVVREPFRPPQESVIKQEDRIEEDEDEVVTKKQHLTAHWKAFRKLCGKIVNHDHVQLFIVVLIIVNAAMMGLATFDFVADSEKVSHYFDATDKAFLVIFTIELILQLIYRGFGLFRDGWLLFDLFVVVTSWSIESLQIVRAFRIFRAFRLITRLAVLRNLVNSILDGAASLSAILALLLLVLYIYAVMCTVLYYELFDLGYTDADYFSSLDKTLFTLFVMMTLDWAGVARQVMVFQSAASMVFGSFVIITSFILYSLVVAIICDAVAENSDSGDDSETVMSPRVVQNDEMKKLQAEIESARVRQDVILAALQQALKEIESDDSSDKQPTEGLWQSIWKRLPSTPSSAARAAAEPSRPAQLEIQPQGSFESCSEF